jgi:hypothetical protein
VVRDQCKIGLIPKAISNRKIPFGQMKFIDKSILCQTFINFEATYQFLGIFKNNRFFSLFHSFNQVHGFRPKNNRFLIDCNVQSNTAIIVKHLHK